MNTTPYKDVRKFVLLEKELNLFEHSYNSFFYWQHIRFAVCESLFGNRNENEKEEKKKNIKSITNICTEVGRAVIESVKLNFHLARGKTHELLFFRQQALSDKFFDTWTLPEEIDVDNYRIAPYTKGKNHEAFYLEGPRIRTAFERRLNRKMKRNIVDEREKAFLIELEKRLILEFGQTISADEMEQLIFDFNIQDKIYSNVYTRIIKRTKCRAIAFVCYYSNELFPAQRIAAEKGITTIEFQHGVINNHEEYWFEDDRGVNNYVPDYLLTFGDVHNTWIKLVQHERAITIGYPFQEKSIQALKDVNTDERVIIVYPVSDPGFEMLIDQLTNDITPLGYHVVVKIHPSQAQNVPLWYPILSKNKNAEIVTNQTMGIYYWLKRAKHHVMASTTVGLEAIAFDHPNICIANIVPHDQVQCLLDWKVARDFSTAEELIELILNPIDLNSVEAAEVRNKLWKDDASNNMTAFFREMKLNNWRK